MKSTQASESLSFLEFDPPQPAVTTLIWLHGLGATCEDFVPWVPELRDLSGLPLRFVFPQAPLRPVTINNGYVMPAWFDISSLDKSGLIDPAGISTSVQQINALIQHEKERGFTHNKIIVAGFSQGAVIALSTLMTDPEKLAGAIALSGFLPTNTQWPSPHRPPIFMGHGMRDEIVPYAYGKAAAEMLIQADYPLSWHTYPMSHSVCEQEVRDLAVWLKEVIAE